MNEELQEVLERILGVIRNLATSFDLLEAKYQALQDRVEYLGQRTEFAHERIDQLTRSE